VFSPGDLLRFLHPGLHTGVPAFYFNAMITSLPTQTKCCFSLLVLLILYPGRAHLWDLAAHMDRWSGGSRGHHCRGDHNPAVLCTASFPFPERHTKNDDGKEIVTPVRTFMYPQNALSDHIVSYIIASLMQNRFAIQSSAGGQH